MKSNRVSKSSAYINHFAFYLTWKTRIILYIICMCAFSTAMFIHFVQAKTITIFIFSFIPIVFAGWFLNYAMVFCTALFFILVNWVMAYYLVPAAGTQPLFAYILYYPFYLFLGLMINKVIRLYRELYNEILKKRKTATLLEEEKNWSRIILLSICDGIITADMDKKIIFMNYEAERLTVWTLDEVKGKNISLVYNIVNEETHVRITDPILRILERGYIVGLANHTILITKNNREICIGDSGTPIKDNEGNILGFILVFRDVSQKKVLELELKKVQAQAIQSEKLAGIGQLAAGIAHEINNPLSYINSNIDTLEKYLSNLKKIIEIYRSASASIANIMHIKSEEEKLKIDFILKDLDSMLADNKEGILKITKIVKNLKDFAYINPYTEWKLIDLNQVIKSVLHIVDNETKYIADVILNLNNLPLILCNASEINQVILNLILNAVSAIKSRRDGQKGRIEIHTAAEDKCIICRITDNGCGIPENMISRIFEPFFTTKEPGEGTGLGLYLAYDIIVKKHKGEILVNSEENKYTRFTLKLLIKAPEFANQ